MKEKINPFTPGLVIMPNGEMISMKEGEDKHAPFFQRILKEEYKKLGIDAAGIDQEDNLEVLCTQLLNQFQILPYQGCTSGDRKYYDGFLYINSLEKLTDEQLPAIIDLYTVVSSQYKMNILQTHTDGNNDNFISLGEIYEEMLKRPTKHM